MRCQSRFLAVVVCAVGLCGCVSLPTWQAPGRMRQQQLRASIFDPYGDPSAGPTIVGGRPREYREPLSESDRSRWVLGTMGQR